MQQYNVAMLMAMVLLTIGFVGGHANLHSASAHDRAPRQVFLSEARLETLKERIEQRTEPTYSAWPDLKSRAERLLDRQPHAPEHWYVPDC